MLRAGLFPLVSAALLVLSACTGLPVVTEGTEGWQQRQTALAALQHWQLEGKLAIRSVEGAESANMRWQQSGNDTALQLYGPIGIGATSVHSDGESLTIDRGDGPVHYDVSTPEAMLASTGWLLPVKELPYWLRGIPAPGPAEPTTDGGLLTSLEQAGWLVIYQEYGQFGQFTLPRKLSLQYEDHEARLVVRQWQTDPAR